MQFHLANAEERMQMRRFVKFAAKFAHPNIVSIEVGLFVVAEMILLWVFLRFFFCSYHSSLGTVRCLIAFGLPSLRILLMLMPQAVVVDLYAMRALVQIPNCTMTLHDRLASM